jgi:hypothetical protein
LPRVRVFQGQPNAYPDPYPYLMMNKFSSVQSRFFLNSELNSWFSSAIFLNSEPEPWQFRFKPVQISYHQQGEDLHKLPTKKELTLDLLTIISDKVMVKFKTGTDIYETDIGRWCNICK